MKNPESSQSSGRYRLVASLSKAVFKADEPVRVKVVFENASDQELPYGAQAKVFDYYLDCRDEQGEPMPFTRFGQRMAGNRGEGRYITSTLPAAEQLVNEISVSRQVDLTLPGRYTLRITREIFPGQGSSDRVHSNVCSFEIVDD
jgi:hypothetical protein